MEEKLSCKFCGRSCANNNALSYHLNRCKLNPDAVKTALIETNCQFCGKTFKSLIAANKHEKNYCSLNPTKMTPVYSYIICDKCGEKFNTLAFKHHYLACNGNFSRDKSISGYHLDHDDLFCKYCGEEYKTKNALAQHEIRCSSNTNYITVRGQYFCLYCGQEFELKSAKGCHEYYCESNPNRQDAWCKGLTKETDERVALNALHVKETMLKKSEQGLNHGCCTSEYWTDEKRQEQSDKKVALYLEHPEKHPNAKLAGNRKLMTYPELLVYDWLVSKNIAFNPLYYTDSFDNHHRWVDFYLPTYNLYVEIDGEHWHKESETDKLKDKFALEVLGITTLRIPAKSRIIETLESYFENLS